MNSLAVIRKELTFSDHDGTEGNKKKEMVLWIDKEICIRGETLEIHKYSWSNKGTTYLSVVMEQYFQNTGFSRSKAQH